MNDRPSAPISDRAFAKPYRADRPSPELWARTGAHDVQRLRALAERRTSRAGKSVLWLAVLTLLAVAVAAYPEFRPARPGAAASFLGGVVALWAGAMCAVAVCLFVRGVLGMRGDEELLARLAPLGERSELCHQAFEMLATPAVRAYRDQVLQAGRELLVVDWSCMSELNRKAQSEALQARTRETCQRLHGLLDEPEAAAA